MMATNNVLPIYGNMLSGIYASPLSLILSSASSFSILSILHIHYSVSGVLQRFEYHLALFTRDLLVEWGVKDGQRKGKLHRRNWAGLDQILGWIGSETEERL